MLALPRSVQVWAYPAPTDLRKGYNGLYALVQHGLERDPRSGELFVFVNRNRTLCKVLMWDGTGLCIFMKRLERGRFAALWQRAETDDDAVRLTAAELSLFIEGCSLLGRRALSPPAVSFRA